MANKYLRHGETFCGDGTTSAAAASAGAVGAWNNINVLEGTVPAFGALAAGDVVHIRSKDAAGADITRAVTANITLGNAAASQANPIHWIIDNGAVWSGVNGTITYQNSSASAWIVLSSVYNTLEARTRGGLTIKVSTASPGADYPIFRPYGLCKGLCVDFSAKTNFAQVYIQPINTTMENCLFKLGCLTNTAISLFGVSWTSTAFRLINCDFVQSYGAASTQPLIGGASYSQTVVAEIIGGSVSGSGLSGQTIFGLQMADGSSLRAVGFQIPKSCIVSQSGALPTKTMEAFGLDGGAGCYAEKPWGFVTTRSDTNHPVLSARIPDSAGTQWSYRIYPRAPTPVTPVALPIAKLFEDTAATKTITLEYLLATGPMVSNTENTWMTVGYIDGTTGATKHLTTQVERSASATTATSTAGWSSASWGSVSCVKRKLSVTTPTTIKQNTTIFVVFHTTMVSSTTDDILFLDPDFSLS